MESIKNRFMPKTLLANLSLFLTFLPLYNPTEHRFFAFQALFTQQHNNTRSERQKGEKGENVLCKHSFCWQTGLGGATEMVGFAGINDGCYPSYTKNWGG